MAFQLRVKEGKASVDGRILSKGDVFSSETDWARREPTKFEYYRGPEPGEEEEPEPEVEPLTESGVGGEEEQEEYEA